MSPRKKREQQLPSYASMQNESPTLPPFASTQEEIKLAVERGAVHRGELLIKVIVSLKLDGILDTIMGITYEKEDIHERREELNIQENALALLDNANPPISYLLYFSIPEFLIRYPELVMYYRNMAMLSRKVMKGIQLPTDAQEDKNIPPSSELAIELSKYFNGIVSKLILASGVSPNRHLEIALSNVGDALGGISRNEVGRFAAAEIMHCLIIHWHSLGYLKSIHFTLKNRYEPDDEDEGGEITDKKQLLEVSPETNIVEFLKYAESNRVKYHEIILNNGYHLLLDRQLKWQDKVDNEKSYKIGPDMTSQSVEIDMVWAGEIKGGADPAGSDEHWKTATQTLNRILEAAKKSGRPKPKLSFLATILVDRVASEAQRWIDGGDLTSVYNLTKIAKSDTERQKFLNDMTEFLGYKSSKT